jgi:hypothetical protein
MRAPLPKLAEVTIGRSAPAALLTSLQFQTIPIQRVPHLRWSNTRVTDSWVNSPANSGNSFVPQPEQAPKIAPSVAAWIEVRFCCCNTRAPQVLPVQLLRMTHGHQSPQ